MRRPADRLFDRARLAALAVGACLTFAGAAAPAEAATALRRCPTLEVCLAVFDARPELASTEDEARRVARHFARYGEPAKGAFFVRAQNPDPTLRRRAGEVLAHWRRFEDADVGPLAAALRRDPGGWAALPLARLGTPEALDALLQDLRNGAASRTGYALASLGPRVLPLLEPVLADDRVWREAATVIRSVEGDVSGQARAWRAVLADPRASAADKRAARRGLDALGPRAGRQACPRAGREPTWPTPGC